MDKFSFIALWDNYRGLLTPLQQEITDMYFNLDLTVSEIAVEKGITRQAVSECMKNSKKQLEEYENRLGFCKKFNELSTEASFKITEAARWAEDFKKSNPDLSSEAEKLIDILSK